MNEITNVMDKEIRRAANTCLRYMKRFPNYESDILKQIFCIDATPALGCTEPIAIALASSMARKKSGQGRIIRIRVAVNLGTLKNAACVTIPGTRESGPQIAAALGALCGNPRLKLEVLQGVTANDIEMAKQMKEKSQIEIICKPEWTDLRIAAMVETESGFGYVVIDGSHTNVVLRKSSKKEIDLESLCGKLGNNPTPKSYTETLKKKTLADLVKMAKEIDDLDRDYIDAACWMNMLLAIENVGMQGIGKGLAITGANYGGINTTVKVIATSATGSRMAGVKRPAAASGGSGNQGVVAILGPQGVGIEWGISKRRIQEAIALSQLINSYIKCHTGDLSAMCGCAIAAGVGMAAALVYMRTDDVNAINMAINNVIGGIAGMLCDGAKGGCSMKVAIAIDAAMMSALLVLDSNYSIDSADGILGATFEETIRNLARISTVGMKDCDREIIAILEAKQR